MEVILYSKECNWYTRCCPLNGGVRYRECLLREATLYSIKCIELLIFVSFFRVSDILLKSMEVVSPYKIKPTNHQVIIIHVHVQLYKYCTVGNFGGKKF